MNEKIKYNISLKGDSKVREISIFRKLFTSKFKETTLATIGIDVRLLYLMMLK